MCSCLPRPPAARACAPGGCGTCASSSRRTSERVGDPPERSGRAAGTRRGRSAACARRAARRSGARAARPGTARAASRRRSASAPRAARRARARSAPRASGSCRTRRRTSLPSRSGNVPSTESTRWPGGAMRAALRVSRWNANTSRDRRVDGAAAFDRARGRVLRPRIVSEAPRRCRLPRVDDCDECRGAGARELRPPGPDGATSAPSSSRSARARARSPAGRGPSSASSTATCTPASSRRSPTARRATPRYRSRPPGSEVLTVEFKLNLLAPAEGDLLIARGRVAARRAHADGLRGVGRRAARRRGDAVRDRARHDDPPRLTACAARRRRPDSER